MNKQRFIAELAQLLSFMTEHDRAAFLKKLSAKFEEAGPEGEAALIAQLGTPTAMAIKVSRSYKPTPAPGPEEVPAENAETAGTDEGGDTAPPQEPLPEQEQSAAPEAEACEAAPEQPEAPEKPALSELFSGGEPAPEIKRETENDIRAVRARRALCALTLAGGITLGCLLLALCAVVLVPGAGCMCVSAFFALAGLWAAPVLTDALFLFGIAAIALAVGIFLLFLAIWLMTAIIKPLVSGTVYLFRLTGGEDR